jgi:hypothetical protein
VFLILYETMCITNQLDTPYVVLALSPNIYRHHPTLCSLPRRRLRWSPEQPVAATGEGGDRATSSFAPHIEQGENLAVGWGEDGWACDGSGWRLVSASASCMDGGLSGGLGIWSSVASPSGSPHLREGSALVTCALGWDLRLGWHD